MMSQLFSLAEGSETYLSASCHICFNFPDPTDNFYLILVQYNGIVSESSNIVFPSSGKV